MVGEKVSTPRRGSAQDVSKNTPEADATAGAYGSPALHGASWGGTSLRQRQRNALGLPRSSPDQDESRQRSPTPGRSCPASPPATRLQGKAEEGRRHSTEQRRSLGDFESLSSRSSQSSGPMSPTLSGLQTELIPEHAPLDPGLPSSLFGLGPTCKEHDSFSVPGQKGARPPHRRTHEYSHEHAAGADMGPSTRIGSLEVIPRLVSDEGIHAQLMDTPRLGSFDASGGSIARSLDSWRPCLPSDEIFCDIDGSQVQKLEKLVGALRALVPSDEERCTILGNELRNALEHRGLSVQIHTVMRMLEDADQIELTKGH